VKTERVRKYSVLRSEKIENCVYLIQPASTDNRILLIFRVFIAAQDGDAKGCPGSAGQDGEEQIRRE